MKTQGKYIEKPYSFRTRFRMVIVAVGCSTSKIENYFKDPFAVGDPPRSCKWNMCKLQGNVIAERAPNGFSMFALHLGKKKHVLSNGYPISIALCRHHGDIQFLRNRSLVPWHPFFKDQKPCDLQWDFFLRKNTSAGWWGTLPMCGVCCGIQSFHTSCPGQKGWLIGFVSKGRKKWRFSSWFTKHYDVQMD